MKKLLSIISLFCLLWVPVIAQNKYKGLPVIKAKSGVADYKIGNELRKGVWGIDPSLSPDVLQVPVHKSKQKVTFYTDQDSISFNVKAGHSYKFYINLNDTAYALTQLQGYGFKALTFNQEQPISAYTFLYEQDQNNAYLQTLRTKYDLDALVAGASNDTEKALRVMNWVHKQWQHDGSNEPSKADALTILEEAQKGERFRCVEYSLVAASCLNAIGLPARMLGLKMKEVETIESGAGHVAFEVYLPDLKKWAMMDAQFDVMPVLNGVPLNAVEFQNAIAQNYDKLEIKSLAGTSKDYYTSWVYPYLYYFDVRFDNRENFEFERENVAGKGWLMLIPAGANIPKVFQRRFKLDMYHYTNSIKDFYGAPLHPTAIKTVLQ
jgi:hypothetical protein